VRCQFEFREPSKSCILRVTNADGRCMNLLSCDKQLTQSGVYRIVFETKDYFDKAEKPAFYPWVEVRTGKKTTAAARE
jgi:5-hydroxyisourate hydrolase-like protein (transthyretin family)